MEPKTRRWILISGALATATIVGVAGALLWNSDPATSETPQQRALKELPPDRPGDVAQSFVNGLFTMDPSLPANQTDAPAAATTAITATKTGMGTSAYQARLASAPPPPADATTTEIAASVTWTMPNSNSLKYDIKIPMQKSGTTWKIHWTPTIIHPQLTEGASLTYRTALADGALLGRDGKPLVAATIPDGIYKAITGQTGDLKGTDGWEVGIATGSTFTALDGKKPVAGERSR